MSHISRVVLATALLGLCVIPPLLAGGCEEPSASPGGEAATAAADAEPTAAEDVVMVDTAVDPAAEAAPADVDASGRPAAGTVPLRDGTPPPLGDCEGAMGSIYLGLPVPAKLGGMSVFAFEPKNVRETGVPTGESLADMNIDPVAAAPATPAPGATPATIGEATPAPGFPIQYRVCVDAADVVMVVGMDVDGDDEVFGAGDYVGKTAAVIPLGGTAHVDITLDHVVTADEVKKGDPPKDTKLR